MSLILEALRKSEAERRRGQGPDIHAELPPPAVAARRAPAPPWVWLLPGAVVLVLGLLWLARHTAPASTPAATRTTVPTVAPQPPSPADVLPAVARLEPPPPAVPALQHAEPAAPPTADAVAAAAPPPARAAMPVPAAGATQLPAAAAPLPTPAPAPPPATDTAGTLQLADLAPEDRKALPALKLSMHMWNDDPAQRFVILDGQRFVEGDRIGDAVVTAILRDGVVLDWNGRRLKLPIR